MNPQRPQLVLWVFVVLLVVQFETTGSRAVEDTDFQAASVSDDLPAKIKNIVVYTAQDPVKYRIECRVRSLSSRSVNVTHFPSDTPAYSVTLEAAKMVSFGLLIDDVIKINEILRFGSGEDSSDILGEELAFFQINSNSTYFVFRDISEYTLSPIPEHLLKEEQFFQNYLEEHGFPWHHHYNSSAPPPGLAHSLPLRSAPTMHMWSAREVGQRHEVHSEHGYWSCDGFSSQCQMQSSLPLTLTVVSTEPRAFIIPDFLNDYECDRIIQLAVKGMNVSQTGGGRVSDYRTSLTAWLPRRVSPMLDSLYRRAADLLRVDEKDLAKRSEQLQIVNYHFGEQYKSHFDWARRDELGGKSRYLTLLLYLTDQVDEEAGGETLFPNTMIAPSSGQEASPSAVALRPVRGTAALFYNLLPDGNGDVSSLHQALPVKKGEKWLANMWIWDPIYTAS